VNTECRRAGIGCVDCKKLMARNLNSYLAPHRAKRIELGRNPQMIWDVLDDGAKRARVIAQETMEAVRAAIGLP
jgi:tryptophanyl-tRNA synthetase